VPIFSSRYLIKKHLGRNDLAYLSRFVLFVVLTGFLSPTVWARSKEERRGPVLDRYRDYLKDRAIDFRKVDASHVEEELMRLKLYKRYRHDAFFIQRGVKYYLDGRKQETGELDLVVIHRSSKKVKYVVEVKRLKHAEFAANYARSQLDRFRESLISSDKITFRTSEKTEFQLNKGNFDQKFKLAIGGVQQKGSSEFFDEVINITRGELTELKEWLRDYQLDRWERTGKVGHQNNYRNFVKSLITTSEIPELLSVYHSCRTAFAEGL